MPTDRETFKAMTATVQKFFPRYKVVAKKSSWLHGFIGWILKTFTSNKDYATRFWTYFNGTNSYPIEGFEGEHYYSWGVHMHEGTHAGQEKKWTSPLWGFAYLLGTPVPAAVLGLLSLPLLVVGLLVSGLPWWASLIVLAVGLILSCPVPFAYWRSEWELQGYGATIARRYWCGGEAAVDDDYIERRVKTFSGGEYFYMNVFKSKVRKRLQEARRLAIQRKFVDEWEPRYSNFYSDCYRTLKVQDRVVGR